MRQFRLVKWYPFLPEEWKDQEITVEKHDSRLNYYGNRDNNPNKQIPAYQVEGNENYWKPVEEEFQEGDWVILENTYGKFLERGNCYRIVKFQMGDKNYPVLQHDWDIDPYLAPPKTSLRKATKDEIEQALIAEAKRRGLIEGGVAVRSLNYNGVYPGKEYNHNIPDCPERIEYDTDRESLNVWYDNSVGCFIRIYCDGNWAEVIEEEPIEINGYVAEFKYGYVQFGCAKINNGLLIDLYRTIDSHRENNGYLGADSREVKSVTIGNGEFSVKDLKQITERIDQ